MIITGTYKFNEEITELVIEDTTEISFSDSDNGEVVYE